MSGLVSVSRAARLAGVSRAEIQEIIRTGRLIAFEGMVKLEALLAVYPGVRPDDDAEIERSLRLQEEALGKYQSEQVSDAIQLRHELNRLRVQLADAKAQASEYRELVCQLHARLIDMQDHCTRRQRLMLQAMISWILSRLEARG
jgi:CDP-4-dehydro-6-deoxyglucose reductase, E3